MNSNSKRPRYPHPENGSIRAILLENPSTRLYIHPLAWNASHLENLSLVLHHLPPHLEPKNVDEPVPDILSRSIYKWTGFCKEIAGIQACESRSERDQLMGYLVRDLALTVVLRGYLAFQYARVSVAKISLPLIFENRQQPTSSPVWAYIDQATYSSQRRGFHRRRKRPYNYVTRLIQEAKALPIDPLYVAILIALGQEAREARGTRESGILKIPQKVSLFVSKHVDAGLVGKSRLVTTLHHYTATITDEYLLEFDEPYHHHGGELHIHHEAIPFSSPLAVYQALERACGGHEGTQANSSMKRDALHDATKETEHDTTKETLHNTTEEALHDTTKETVNK
ncbi:hypothetical protein V500_06808 [Pseudogymnoascus sp. VKM F-4518 (FW-2643)]|nr:hypothetical protein V500_06808 [Pseudogymnoascus sp. VKM F-4518 (FW-2643)]